jgi:methylmalonyl-CoA mutase cobalamin-binding domain/chain
MGKIAEAIAKLDKNSLIGAVKEGLQRNRDPLKMIDELRQGLDAIGEKYQKGEYFLLELIMAGELFKDASFLLLPEIKKRYGGAVKKGKVLMGTVAGDIHDLGKNITATFFECAGFEVIDLGVDVPAEVFVKKIKEHKPQIVGMSGLLTASIDEMNKTVEAIERANLRKEVKVIVGGGIVGEEWTKDRVKADAATTSSVEGVKIIEGWVGC